MDPDASISLTVPLPPRTVPIIFLIEPIFHVSFEVHSSLPFAVVAHAHACLLQIETGCRVLARARCTDGRSNQEQV